MNLKEPLRSILTPAVLFTLLLIPTSYAQPLAFPGAEGWAAATPGGRGGAVIKVTNLDADGPGSLKAALEAEGARTVIFDVGGIIDLAGTSLVIENPFITVAGQSAPYPGITIIDGGIEIRGCNDVIIQHIRVRPGAARHSTEIGVWEPDGISTNFSNHVIVDHCSISWGVDENLSASGPRFDGANVEEWRSNTSRQITFSNNIVAEALFEATHGDGMHSRASLLHDNTTEIAIIKNLYAHNNRRSPLFKAGARGVVMNNVVYNPGQLAMHYSSVATEWAEALGTIGTPPDALLSVVGNNLVWGPNNHPIDNPVPMFVTLDEFPGIPELAESVFLKLFLEDNARFDHTGTLNPDLPELTNHLGEPAPQYVVTEKPIWNDNFVQLSASELPDYLASNAGARPWEADPVDDRIVADWQNRTGSLINFETDVGGFPVRPSTSRSPEFDGDNDGMPDAWERLKGLNPDEADHNGTDLDATGYTNVEVYLHELNALGTSNSPAIAISSADEGYDLTWTNIPNNGHLQISSDMTQWSLFADASIAGIQGFNITENDRVFLRWKPID